MAETRRLPYQEPRVDVELRPAASPVDTFVVAPQVVQDNSLADLARGLSKMDAGLQGMLDERKKEQDAKDAINAEADFHKNNREGYAEAIQKGLIPAYSSKAYVESYKRAQGDVAGYDLEQRFAAAYDGWGGKGDPDPAKFDAFLSGFLKDNIKTDDPEVLRGLVPRLRALTANAVAKSSTDRHSALVNGSLATAGAQVNIAIDEAHARGLATKKGTDYEGLFSFIETNRAEKIAAGANPEDLDKTAIDRIVLSAVDKRDPKLLGFFDRKVPGKDYTYGQTPYGQTQKAATIEKLETMGRKAIVEEERLRKEAESKEKDEVTRLAIESLATNPDAPFPEELLARGAKVEPEFRTKVNTWRSNIRKNQAATNPQALLELHQEIVASGGRNTDTIIARAAERGTLTNAADFDTARKLAEEMKKNGVKVEEMLKSSSATAILGVINKRTQGDSDIGNPFAPEGMTDEGFQAQLEFKRMVLDWAGKNPEATTLEKEEALAKFGAVILGRLGRKDEGTGAATFNREGLPPDNPYAAQGGQPVPSPQAQTPAPAPRQPPTQPAAPSQQPQQPSASPDMVRKLREDAAYYEKLNPEAARQFRAKADELEAQTRSSPVADPVDPQAAKSWYDALPAETKQRAADMAARTGRPLSDVVLDAYTRQRQQQQQQQQQQPTAPVAPSPVEPPPQVQPQRQGAVSNPEGATVQLASLLEEFGSQVQAALANYDENAPANQELVRQFGALLEKAFSDGVGNTASYTLASLKDDPKAAKLLDFISGPESRGNYNAVFGRANNAEDLSAFTVDGILARQQAQRQAGAKSTAVGRYQIIYKTMAGLKRQLGLSGSERFTPELQDRMALQLLRNRGYDRFASGKMGLHEFALQLAQEWASLPDPRTGRSYYAGDGLNRSHVSPAQVAAALNNDQ